MLRLHDRSSALTVCGARFAVRVKVSPDTVMRDSRLAKAWLARRLSGDKG